MIELVTRMLEQINHSDFPPPQPHNPTFARSPSKQKLRKLEDRNKNSEYRKVRTVYELGYKLLESVAANNDLMKIKISKYMNKYLHHIMEKANRTVYRSIQEFLDGNYLALEEINDHYISNLISHFDENDPDPADLYFLSRLCLCKDRTVPRNQIQVFENFYQQGELAEEPSAKKYSMEEKLAANKFKFREDQKKMQILSRIIPSSEPQYRTLSELFEECNLMRSEGGYDPDKNHWSYFMQYLNLLADICVQRNEKPLEYIKKSLPLKTLVAFLHENTVKKNLLFQPFIRLVHHAFVETSAYEEINRITKVKEWNELGNFKIPCAKNAIPADIKKTMGLIFDYIRRINKLPFERRREKAEKLEKTDRTEEEKLIEPETIDFNVDDRNRLINVKTFLEILKSTLNLGFWPDIDEMKRMVPFLLKVMRFDIEYANKVLEETKDIDRKNNENQHLSDA
jgi:inositol 1,4,5-triphosphate receptor type 1/inositol 1,4,5-triphosphate receptor type 3